MLKGWIQNQIAQALRIRPETVHDHLKDYQRDEKLKPTKGGSKTKLSDDQTSQFIKHLEEQTYLTVSEICVYI